MNSEDLKNELLAAEEMASLEALPPALGRALADRPELLREAASLDRFRQVLEEFGRPAVPESLLANQRAKIRHRLELDLEARQAFEIGRQLPKGSLVVLIAVVAGYFLMGLEGVVSQGQFQTVGTLDWTDPLASFGLVYLFLLGLAFAALIQDQKVLQPRLGGGKVGG